MTSYDYLLLVVHYLLATAIAMLALILGLAAELPIWSAPIVVTATMNGFFVWFRKLANP